MAIITEMRLPMSKWVLDTFEGTKTWYSDDVIERIRQEIQEDVTCESRECGCDDYGECLECLKNTILQIIKDEDK